MPPYAEVVVHAPISRRLTARDGQPIGGTYHYTIPDELQDSLVPGSLVSVPFGERILQGVVVGLSDSSPVAETRPILGLAQAEPVLSPAQLALARWISETYLAPLMDAVRLFVPPGLMPAAEPVLERVAAAPLPSDLTDEQGALLARLQHGPLRWRYARRHHAAWTQPKTLQPLLDAGVVRKQRVILRRVPRPRPEQRLKLLADEATIRRYLLHLGRPSKQADVLAWLLASDDPLPTLAQVCKAADCGEEVVRRLAARGWLDITTPQEWLALAVAPHDVDTLLAGELARAPAQAQALAALRDAHAPLSPDELAARAAVNLSTVRQLEKRGLIRRAGEAPQVLLALPRAEVPQRIIELRGLEKHQAALDALQRAGGAAWIGWLYAETPATRATLRELEAARLIETEPELSAREALAGQAATPDTPPPLTPDQQRVWQAIEPGLAQGKVFLLHGVTGSGKTEIYLRALAATLAQGRQAIALVPEIALTPQTVRRFAARFPNRLTLLHGSLSPGERVAQWRRLREGAHDIVVGPRSALFAPLARLGLIILDEEHEPAYKQERSPRYHARDAALQLAKLTGAAVILGSATPSLEAYHRAQQGEFRLLHLPRRIRSGPMPPVEVVDMRDELKAGNRSIFSRTLQQHLHKTLDAGEQAILYINRRGAATFILCRDCGHALACPRCDAPLVMHFGTDDLLDDSETPRASVLVCHRCGRRMSPPTGCPQCGSRRIRHFGAGTQRIELEVQTAFPQARTLRWDRDVVQSPGMHQRILDRFMQREANVLIGTQMVAKGLDLPWVTLVGAVAADTGLFLPDLRANERTFQLLTQVVGRAGRTERGGRAIIQTYNPAAFPIQAAAAHDYAKFFAGEAAFRRRQGYPPFQRLARLLLHTRNEATGRREAERLARRLRDYLNRRGLPRSALIGPAPCFLARVRGYYRWHLILRAVDPAALLREFDLPRGWQVDIDPGNLL